MLLRLGLPKDDAEWRCAYYNFIGGPQWECPQDAVAILHTDSYEKAMKTLNRETEGTKGRAFCEVHLTMFEARVHTWTTMMQPTKPSMAHK